MTIHIEKVRGGFVVSEDGAWVEGAYDTADAARFAVSLDPDALAELWRSALARDPDALLTLDDLRGGGQ